MSTTNLRAAAFLAEQARLDFRRGGASKVQCLPPNRACGNRCIPPNWDCRLRGEGNDPHLRAAGTGIDPVAGFANLQRGLTNIGRGIAKLNFSDVESGRRSLARGTAKLHPGDLKKKEEAKKAVYNYGMWVLTPVVIGIGAALTHKGLKSFKIYRNGVGADIDNTFREVTDKIARNTPFGIGEGIRAREAAGRRGLASMRSTELAQRETLGRRTETSTTFLQRTSARRNPKAGDGSAAINKALEAAKTNTTSVDEWYNRSLSAFWGVKRSGDLQKIAGDIGDGSLYSIDSTNTLLARSLGLRGTNGRPLELPGTDLTGESRQVRALIRSRIAAERENIAVGMRQASLNPKDAGEVQEYLRRNASEWQTGDVDVDNDLSKTIVNTMTGNDDARMADEFYRNTVKQFDTYYKDINDLVTNTPGLTTLNSRQRQLYQDAVRGHAKYLTGTMDFDMPIEGSGSIALLKKVYYRRRVVGKTARYATVTLTDTELATVAQELGINIKNRPPFSLERAINEHFEEKSRSMWDSPRARVKPKIVVRRYQAPATEAQQKLTQKEINTPEVGATSPTPETTEPKPNRRYKANINQITNRLIRAGYTPEEARIKAAEYIAEREARQATRGDSDDWTTRDEAHFQTWIHLDKRCGKSGIPDNLKCNKQTTPSSSSTNPFTGKKSQAPTEAGNNQESVFNPENAKKAGIGASVVATAALLATIGIKTGQVTQYRKNVSRSAVEAEKLSLELERTMKEQAASRLKKKVEDVTGFEASTYNFKDKGHDRGFSGMDSEPAWFGQTKNSRGAVVMLSYADDNKFTTRGQGSYKMVENGAFKQIWGDRDILPYANNISQPKGQDLDDVQFKNREQFLDKVGSIGGKKVRDVTKGVLSTADRIKQFDYLRQNVNERGFNPDALRAAAFVAAQRRLTGKPVDIMSYSNGGNVATEALAILQEMGYRDVKVVNVAGPTFGIFNHSRDNMRTWVSPGDEFFKYSNGAAFTGGNTQVLNNPNIPHGLSEKIDPNNKEFGANARENYKAGNSYMLDKQLQREAYTYLTVDKQRSRELLNEVAWRASENKGFEGDLKNLFGDESEAKATEFSKLLNSTNSSDEARDKIRDEIENRMLDVWYGGYNPTAVKNAQKDLRKEVIAQATPKAAPSRTTPRVRPQTPTSFSQRIQRLMEQNPGMSEEAARKEIQRRMRGRRSDAYTKAFELARQVPPA
jgi:hypothetical protein